MFLDAFTVHFVSLEESKGVLILQYATDSNKAAYLQETASAVVESIGIIGFSFELQKLRPHALPTLHRLK